MSDFALRHGEAVAIGVAIDTVYSSLVHGLPQADARRVLRCLSDLGLPLDAPGAGRREHALRAGWKSSASTWAAG